jgi:hypothetical protein
MDQKLYIKETHTHISTTKFVTSFFHVIMFVFDLYVLKNIYGMGPSFAVGAANPICSTINIAITGNVSPIYWWN